MLKKIQKQAGEVLEFPSDVLVEGPKVTIMGRAEIIVEYFQEVIQFSEEEIILKTAEGKLVMKGKGFVLTAVLPTEIHVKGKIFYLSFTEEGLK